jgi:hypothetical protein
VELGKSVPGKHLNKRNHPNKKPKELVSESESESSDCDSDVEMITKKILHTFDYSFGAFQPEFQELLKKFSGARNVYRKISNELTLMAPEVFNLSKLSQSDKRLRKLLFAKYPNLTCATIEHHVKNELVCGSTRTRAEAVYRLIELETNGQHIETSVKKSAKDSKLDFKTTKVIREQQVRFFNLLLCMPQFPVFEAAPEIVGLHNLGESTAKIIF